MPISRWRISALSPVRRDLGRLDFERCAALHNEIIERGWIGSGHALEELDRTTYWVHFQDDATWQNERVDPSLVEFFKLAIYHPSQTFFYTADGIAPPGNFFDGCNFGIDADANRYVQLYTTTDVFDVSHANGILFDQHTHLAIFQPDMLDSSTTMDGQRVQWQPLEVIFDGFLDMIDQGKVTALPDDPGLSTEAGRAKPWEAPWSMSSFSRVDLRAALSQFERLVEAIESRMPPGSLPDVAVEYGYFNTDSGSPDESDSTRMLRQQTFAHRFLSALRRPRFPNIAPGLSCLPGPQPFASQDPVDDFYTSIRPVLLARGDAAAEGDVGFTESFEDTPTIPCGLFLPSLTHMGRCHSR